MFCTIVSAAKAACFRSLTMAWSYILVAGGGALANIDTLASVVTDKMVSDNVASLIGANPVVMGKWLATVGVITTAARVRGIMAKPQQP